jgi:hypothetical protein
MKIRDTQILSTWIHIHCRFGRRKFAQPELAFTMKQVIFQSIYPYSPDDLLSGVGVLSSEMSLRRTKLEGR